MNSTRKRGTEEGEDEEARRSHASKKAAAAGGGCDNTTELVQAASDFFSFFTSEDPTTVDNRNAVYKRLTDVGVFTAGATAESFHQQLAGNSLLLTALPNAIGNVALICGDYTFKAATEIAGHPQEVLNTLVAIYVLNQAPTWATDINEYIRTTISGIQQLAEKPENADLIKQVKDRANVAADFARKVAAYVNKTANVSADILKGVGKNIGITGYFIKEALVYMFLSRTPYDDASSVHSRLSTQSIAKSIASIKSALPRDSTESRVQLPAIAGLDDQQLVQGDDLNEMIQNVINIHAAAAAAEQRNDLAGLELHLGDGAGSASQLTASPPSSQVQDGMDLPPGIGHENEGGSKKRKRTKKNKKTKTKKSKTKKQRKSTRKHRH